jgi:hypothetical protein
MAPCVRYGKVGSLSQLGQLVFGIGAAGAICGAARMALHRCRSDLRVFQSATRGEESCDCFGLENLVFHAGSTLAHDLAGPSLLRVTGGVTNQFYPGIECLLVLVDAQLGEYTIGSYVAKTSFFAG